MRELTISLFIVAYAILESSAALAADPIVCEVLRSTNPPRFAKECQVSPRKKTSPSVSKPPKATIRKPTKIYSPLVDDRKSIFDSDSRDNDNLLSNLRWSTSFGTSGTREVCRPGPYIIFFDFSRYAITPEALSILDNAQMAYRSCGSARIVIYGHDDATGPIQIRRKLSQLRANAVQRYFLTVVIPIDGADVLSYGSDQLRIPTAQGVRELQNRRVEIVFKPR